MNEFATVFNAVLPVFGIVLAGFLIRKLDWLTEEADRSLLRVNVNLLMPCLILDSALGNPALGHVGNLMIAPVIGFGTTAAGVLIALTARRLHGLANRASQNTFALSVGMFNYSYLPVPLALLLFDKETVGVLFVHNVGVETCLWTVGVMTLAGATAARDWRKIVNGPLVAIVLALILNGTGANHQLPSVVRQAMHWLAQCSVPMALILIGAIVADYMKEFHSASSWRVIGSAVLLRIGVLPWVFLLLAKYLPVSVELKRVIVLQASMPCAVIPIVMSKLYPGDPPTAVRAVISTSIIALATIPLWLRFGIKFVGL